MKYEDALKKIEGAQSVGGDLIVVRDGKHIVVGKHVQGMFIVSDGEDAKAVMVEAGLAAEVEVLDSTGEAPPEPGQPLPGEPPAPNQDLPKPPPEAAQLPAEEPAPAPKSRK